MFEMTTTMARQAASAANRFVPDNVVSLAPRCRGVSSPRGSGTYDIRIARTQSQQGAVNRLVRRMYAWRGYDMPASSASLGDPNRMTLAVWDDDEPVATLTLGRDSPSGLLADGLYAREIAGLRQRGRVVCEVTRLAAHPEFSSGHMLHALFHAALVFSREYFRASDAVIEVNPRHVRFYERRFGFRQIGTLRQCQRVNAPAVLLHQMLDRLTAFGAAHLYLPDIPDELAASRQLAAAC